MRLEREKNTIHTDSGRYSRSVVNWTCKDWKNKKQKKQNRKQHKSTCIERNKRQGFQQTIANALAYNPQSCITKYILFKNVSNGQCQIPPGHFGRGRALLVWHVRCRFWKSMFHCFYLERTLSRILNPQQQYPEFFYTAVLSWAVEMEEMIISYKLTANNIQSPQRKLASRSFSVWAMTSSDADQGENRPFPTMGHMTCHP